MNSELADFLWKLLFFIVTSVLSFICAFMAKKLKNYKKLLKEKDDDHLNSLIDIRIEPLRKDLVDLKDMLTEAIHREEALEDELLGTYRFRLTHLCRMYISQKYITQDQYDQLLEMYKLYTYLGGNGQTKRYFEKVEELPIVTDTNALTHNSQPDDNR